MIAAWMNPLWNTLDRRLLKKMYRQLGAEFDAFVEVCQDTGLLQNNFVQMNQHAELDVGFACALCASAVVSAANHYGGQGHLDAARQLATWATMLEPHHVPAYLCLQTVAEAQGDGAGAAHYSSTMRHICQEILNTQEYQRTAFERGLSEFLKQIS